MAPCVGGSRIRLQRQRKHTDHSITQSHAAMSSSSSSNSKAKRSTGLQGRRAQPLSLTTRPSKKPRVVAGSSDGGPAGPVIIYEHTPRIIHAAPDEFMSVVQRLTGKQQSFSSTSTAATLPEPEATSGARDDDGASTSAPAEALALALGQQQRTPCGDDHPGPSTSPSAASSLLSPSSFIFSPATMRAIRELISEC
nr:VQ motif-containing protein 8, chloroplastic-like [Lolium perenne]